jgi:hypothetical protein
MNLAPAGVDRQLAKPAMTQTCPTTTVRVRNHSQCGQRDLD